MAVRKQGLSGWAIAGIVLGGLVVLGILLMIGLVSCVALLSAPSNESSRAVEIETEGPRIVEIETESPRAAEIETSSPAPTKDPAESAISVSADELLAAYKDNEVAADKKYKGKMLLVEGVVDSIGKDIFDNVYVTLGGSFENVHCTFDKQTEIDKVAELHQGDSIKILGKCTGLTITSPMMDNCSVIE
jgi:hypothetical protein